MSLRLGAALSALCGVAFLYWLSSHEQAALIWPQIMSVPWSVLFFVALTQLVSYLSRAARLYGEFRQRLPLGFLSWLRISLLHNASVNVIPLRGGELLFPILLKKAGLPFQQAMASLIWLRVQDALVLLCLVLLLFDDLPLVLRSVGLLLTLILVMLIYTRRDRLFVSVRSSLLLRWLRGFGLALSAPLTSWCWATLNWLCKFLGLSLLLSSLASVPFLQAGQGILGGELSALLPIQGAAGFGTYEAAVAFALGGGSLIGALMVPAFVVHCFVLASALLVAAVGGLLLPAIPAQINLAPLEPSSL